MAFGGCTGDQEALFERLPAVYTGIDFNNTIVEDDSLLNPFDMEYIYNGAGVAVGDLNGDGRPDLYFGGNMVESKLYLNQGNLRFEDVTAEAGVAAKGAWATGVAVVDINQDGLLDLYVCVAGPRAAEERANMLFVNQGVDGEGVPRFEEQAEEYGIADTGYSTQAAFFDYDQDGDLDLFLLTNALEDSDKNRVRPRRMRGEASSTDRLYRNNGDSTFSDVSDKTGIQIEGYGLGVAISDINQDGWPDIYVANDFITNDLIYVNNGDGTFTNKAAEWLKHQTHNGMGADVADYNNDGRPDIVVLDMLPPDNYRQKMMIPSGNYEEFHRALDFDYEPQYLRNTLQLNNGISPEGTLTFSEVGQLAGVHATDWSWAPLFADFDNDGWKDLFVTNGYGKDVTNLDFAAHSNQIGAFGTREANRRDIVEAYKELSEVKLPNVIYRNDGDLTFTEKTKSWGMDLASLSTGAVFADLDGDGDLDLITNNINDEAFVFANRLNERDTSRAYLRVRLEGTPNNREGFGAKIALRSDGELQYHEHYPYRGYKSTVETVAHFGLDTTQQVDSLEILWPDGRYELLTDVEVNQELTLRHAETLSRPSDRQKGLDSQGRIFEEVQQTASNHLFEEEAYTRGLVHEHEEYEVNDFRRTPLLPRKLSQGGPALAVGDINGDGLDDVYVGADKGQERKLFMQRSSGQFAEQPLPMQVDQHEDRGALFFDADGDGHLDLYVVSGGNHAPAGNTAYQDRLYLGDGQGGFRRSKNALPEIRTSGSVVTAADYDGDGDFDLFVGGRHRPGEYPLPPRSYLLENDGAGRFRDVTEEQAPELAEVGMVADALWTDYDRDGQLDLFVGGEWMPLTLFENQGNAFEDITAEAGLAGTTGWWNSFAAGDFDGDGDLDYVAGNLGKNAKFEASPEEPIRIYAEDFDRNGSIDPVMTRYIDGEEVPAHPRDLMVEQMPVLKRHFPTYSGYAEATFREVFTEEELEEAYMAEAERFETSYIENQGDGTFTVQSLPLRAQFAPVFGMQVSDFDGDGYLDLLMVGNSYAAETTGGWHDAFTGLLLRGDGSGRFEAMSHTESGFFVDGDAEALATVVTGDGSSLVIVAQNGGQLKAFVRRFEEEEYRVRLRAGDRYAVLRFREGRSRREEFYYGQGYLSQSSRVWQVPASAVEAVVVDAEGQERIIDLDEAVMLVEQARAK